MANVQAYQRLGEPFVNEQKFLKFTWDFDVDGGAAGTYTLGTVDHKMLLRAGYIHVETACTSGGSATVQVGFTTADADAILNTTSGAVANLTDDVVDTESAATNLVVAAGDTLDLVIGTAALTAGKINVFVEYVLID